MGAFPSAVNKIEANWQILEIIKENSLHELSKEVVSLSTFRLLLHTVENN